MEAPIVREHWNAGGWWGGLVGGGLGWMLLVAVEITVRSGQWWAALIVVLSALSLLGLATLLWRIRAGVPPATGGLVLLLALFPAAVASFAVRELAGLSDYPIRRLWPLLLIVVLIPGLQLTVRARRSES